MSAKIRLSRGGAKKRPYYYIVVAHSSSPRDGRYIEQIGTFNPMLKKDDPASELKEVLNSLRAETAAAKPMAEAKVDQTIDAIKPVEAAKPVAEAPALAPAGALETPAVAPAEHK